MNVQLDGFSLSQTGEVCADCSKNDVRAKIRAIVEREEDAAGRESASYWLVFVLTAAFLSAVVALGYSVSMSMMNQNMDMDQRGNFSNNREFSGGGTPDRGGDRQISRNGDSSRGDSTMAANVGGMANNPVNGALLVRVLRVSGAVAMVTAVIFGIVFQITDSRYRKQLVKLESIALKLPYPDALAAIESQYLNHSAGSPVYEKIVLDLLVCAGPPAVPTVTKFMNDKLDEFIREGKLTALMFVEKSAETLLAINDPNGTAAVNRLANQQKEIRDRFQDSFHQEVDRVEIKTKMDAFFDRMNRMVKERSPLLT